MNTSIAAGAAIPPDDPDIVSAMLAASSTSGTLNRRTDQIWQVGVRNDSGVIYRTGTFRSVNQLRRLAMRMDRIGYVNEVADAPGRPVGFDAVFSRPRGPGPASRQSGA